MPKICPNCNSTDFDTDPARGDTVCIGCGSVLEENNIISEVRFAENADGSSSVIGQFVSSEGLSGPHISGMQAGSGRDFRAVTLDRGRREINDIGSRLKLGKHHCECTYNCFKLAQKYGFMRGRKLEHVAVACWYLTCRLQNLPYLLIDFSDVAQVNVFALGKIFIGLADTLFIKLPVLDPCMYINRFAQKMDFKEKTKDVILAANRLVSRMKRDWIHTGRRPSGLCGAALLVAARMYGFSCSVKDVVKVVRIGKDTIKKRLMEFDETPSSQLTINEFLNVDLESSQDPPAFNTARVSKMQDSNMLEIENEINQLSSAIDDEISKDICKKRKVRKRERPIDDTAVEDLLSDSDKNLTEQFVNAVNPESIDINNEETLTPTVVDGIVLPVQQLLTIESTEKHNISSQFEAVDGHIDTENTDDTELDEPDLSDSEIDKLLLSPDEVRIKTKIWDLAYGEIYEEILAKEEVKRQEAEEKEKLNPKKKKISREVKTADEAIDKMLKRKRLSNKINYDALKGLDDPIKSGNKIKEISPAPGSKLEKYSQKFESIGLDVKSDLPMVLKNTDIKRKTARNITNSFMSGIEENQVAEENVVIESGPLPTATEQDDDLLDDMEDDDDANNMSAAQLLNKAGIGANYGAGEDYGYDDFD